MHFSIIKIFLNVSCIYHPLHLFENPTLHHKYLPYHPDLTQHSEPSENFRISSYAFPDLPIPLFLLSGATPQRHYLGSYLMKQQVLFLQLGFNLPESKNFSPGLHVSNSTQLSAGTQQTLSRFSPSMFLCHTTKRNVSFFASGQSVSLIRSMTYNHTFKTLHKIALVRKECRNTIPYFYRHFHFLGHLLSKTMISNTMIPLKCMPTAQTSFLGSRIIYLLPLLFEHLTNNSI